VRSGLPVAQPPRRRALLVPALVAAIATIAVATIGGELTELGPWYQALKKPVWQPPDWLFPPAWTLIFTLTAIAGVLAWQRAPDRRTRVWLIALLTVNALLNIGWSAIFFRWQRPDLALAEVVFLWLSILALILFTSYAKTASRLLLPYLAWVSFAAVLNLAVVRLNAPFS
jgi:tryptophan-rich sensory protein